MAREQANIEAKVFKLLKKSVNEETGRGYELKVMAWVVNGKQLEAGIAHQETYRNDSGQDMNGKMKLLTGADLWIILENIHEVCKLMKIPEDRLAQVLGAATPVGEDEPF
jgi:hypothetical protein